MVQGSRLRTVSPRAGRARSPTSLNVINLNRILGGEVSGWKPVFRHAIGATKVSWFRFPTTEGTGRRFITRPGSAPNPECGFHIRIDNGELSVGKELKEAYK